MTEMEMTLQMMNRIGAEMRYEEHRENGTHYYEFDTETMNENLSFEFNQEGQLISIY